ncbi:MAG: hypothetical protein U0800_20645 [Isosphaeraceae bacterium]
MAAPPPPAAPPEEPETEEAPEEEADPDEILAEAEAEADEPEADEEQDEIPEEFIDESNPFYAAKKKGTDAPAASKQESKDSSEAAGDILRRLMERRRAR